LKKESWPYIIHISEKQTRSIFETPIKWPWCKSKTSNELADQVPIEWPKGMFHDIAPGQKQPRPGS